MSGCTLKPRCNIVILAKRALTVNIFLRYLFRNLDCFLLIILGQSCDHPEFFLVQFYNKPAIVKGRGDELTFIEIPKTYYVLLVKSIYGSSTEQVFKEADKYSLETGDLTNVLKLFINEDLTELGKNVFNSLYKPASILQEKIIDTFNDVKKYGFEVVSMSGSGSTIFAISTNTKLLKKAEKELYFKGYQTILTKLIK